MNTSAGQFGQPKNKLASDRAKEKTMAAQFFVTVSHADGSTLVSYKPFDSLLEAREWVRSSVIRQRDGSEIDYYNCGNPRIASLCLRFDRDTYDCGKLIARKDVLVVMANACGVSIYDRDHIGDAMTDNRAEGNHSHVRSLERALC